MSYLYDMGSGELVKSRLYTNSLLLKDSLGFNPLSLFDGGNQGVWYDPSDKTSLFQDVAGTVPVTKDGDPVALMKDKSGNGNHVEQTVSTARPIYRTDDNLHWLQFDGVDDYMESVSSFNPRSVVVAMINKKNGSSSGFSLWNLNFFSRHNNMILSGESSAGGEYGIFTSSLADLRATYVASLVLDNQDSRLSFRGVSATTTGGIYSIPTTATKLYLGARIFNESVSGLWRGQIDIFELIITESVLSVNDEALVADYVSGNIGITL